ncbi:Alpha/Beta hydrolase protein [Scenedesmus sp. NREL 46B-D3]|nr:Alpha/Beta hydrolase protein [Scenedesmus sp. NREL 46B-D3]
MEAHFPPRLGKTTMLDTPNSLLELEIHESAVPTASRGALILHPWAKLGGCMEDPTVITQFRAAIRSGLFSHVCRYNMRGAGASKTKWTKNIWDPDVQDMLAVAQHMLQLPNGPQELVVIGYSYGACIAAHLMEHLPQVVAYVGIGFPLGGMANLALRSRDHWQHLADTAVPKLVVQGTRDKFAPLTTIRDYAQQYHDMQPPPGRLDLEIVDGADHFFDGIWDVVAEKVLAWIRKQTDRQQPGGA